MQEIYRSEAYDVEVSDEYYIVLYRNSLQIIDRITGQLVQILHTTKDYYKEIFFQNEENIIIAFCEKRNSIHILDIPTLKLRKVFNLENTKEYCRESLQYDETTNCVYSMIFPTAPGERKTIVTKISLKDYTEELLIILNDFFVRGVCYSEVRKDYFFYGSSYKYRRNPLKSNFTEKGIWMKSREEVSFRCSVLLKSEAVDNVIFTKSGELLYFINGENGRIQQGKKNFRIEDGIDKMAFSKNRRSYTYIKGHTLCICDVQTGGVIEENEIHESVYHINKLKYCGKDKFILLRNDEEAILYNIRNKDR